MGQSDSIIIGPHILEPGPACVGHGLARPGLCGIWASLARLYFTFKIYSLFFIYIFYILVTHHYFFPKIWSDEHKSVNNFYINIEY